MAWFLSELIIKSLESSNTPTALYTEAQFETATAESQKLEGAVTYYIIYSLASLQISPKRCCSHFFQWGIIL